MVKVVEAGKDAKAETGVVRAARAAVIGPKVEVTRVPRVGTDPKFGLKRGATPGPTARAKHAKTGAARDVVVDVLSEGTAEIGQSAATAPTPAARFATI